MRKEFRFATDPKEMTAFEKFLRAYGKEHFDNEYAMFGDYHLEYFYDIWIGAMQVLRTTIVLEAAFGNGVEGILKAMEAQIAKETCHE